MPRVIKKKTKKKETGAEVDVKDRLTGIKHKIRERQRTAMIATAAVVVLVLVAGFVYVYKNTMDEKARKLEYEAYKIYYNEYQKAPLADAERFQKSLELFKQAYNSRKSARVLLYIASAQFGLNKPDEALASLSELVKSFPSDKDVLALAYMKTAEIQLKKGNKAEALKALDSLYKSDIPIYKDYALITEGRTLEADGKKDEAAAKFRELAEKFKDSPFYEEAKAKLGGEKKEK
ncbi:MAG: tetratricopeptide repeat protein [Nitrospiraceae bacterium]|nr:tetratricopeptide repeat protein [Nitrospiraceae bacterium]